MAGFSYFPHTDADIRAMLERIGVGSLDELYADVPPEFLHKGDYDLPDALSEAVSLERMKITPLGCDWQVEAYPAYPEI